MTTKVEINRHIREFENMLDKYSSYKSCLRSLKINSIMNIKSEFVISDMNPRLSIDLNNSTKHGFVPEYSNINAIYSILSMSFIIDQNLYVDTITLVYEVANRPLLEEVKKHISDFKISPVLEHTGIDKKVQVSGFYLEIGTHMIT